LLAFSSVCAAFAFPSDSVADNTKPCDYIRLPPVVFLSFWSGSWTYVYSSASMLRGLPVPLLILKWSSFYFVLIIKYHIFCYSRCLAVQFLYHIQYFTVLCSYDMNDFFDTITSCYIFLREGPRFGSGSGPRKREYNLLV
jgi:hypothetical protein